MDLDVAISTLSAVYAEWWRIRIAPAEHRQRLEALCLTLAAATRRSWAEYLAAADRRISAGGDPAETVADVVDAMLATLEHEMSGRVSTTRTARP